MTWYYTEMVQWHVVLAWCSIALFFGRGLLFQFGTPRLQSAAKDARLLVLVFGVNACLVVTGLSLWGSIGYHPVRDWWLGVKVIALIGYAPCWRWRWICPSIDSSFPAEPASPSRMRRDGPPRMEARPTGSGGEPSSPKRCNQCRG